MKGALKHPLPEGAQQQVLKIEDIQPTHACFDDTMDFISRRIKEAMLDGSRPPRHLVLVHGICLMPAAQENAGQPFAHAWVEEGKLCWDTGLANGQFRCVYAVDREEYYAHLRPQCITRYTLEQVYEENKRTATYGPWKEEYLALCRKNESSSEAHS